MKKSAKATKRTQKKSSKLIKQERGVSKVILVAVVAIILAVGGGVYVLSQNGSLPGMSAGIVKAPLNPNCAYNDPELCKFFNNYANMPKKYSVTTSGTYGKMATESTYTMDGDDKYQMVSKQDGKENSNMITIGETMYMLDYADNTWSKWTTKPMEIMEEETAEQTSFNPQEVEDTTKYTFVTKESCGSLNCFKYEMITADSEGTKMFIWFDDRDYLMRKMFMSDGKGMSSESVYSYDVASISEPSPVKEGTPTTNSTHTMPSDADVQKMMQQYQESAGDSYTEETPVTDTSEGF